MKRFFKYIVLISLLTACSQETIRQNESTEAQEERASQLEKTKLAQQTFIDGSILETQGQYDKAIEKYLEALKLDSQPGILYSIAKDYYAINKLSSAVRFAEQATHKDPTNVEYLNLLAAVYSASHLEDSSAVVYKKIIDLDSTDITAYYSLAQLEEAKRPSEAIKLYKKVIELMGPEWSVLVRLIELNERVGNIPETIKMVEELLKLNPSDLQLQKVLIDSYIKEKDYDKALTKLNEASLSFPDDPNLADFKGRIFIAKGQWREASAEYLKLVKNPNLSFEGKIHIGTSFFVQGDKDSNNISIAKEIFEEINKDTSDWQVNAYLGEIGIREKQDSLAIGYFKKAAELAEWNAQVWQRLGGLLFDNRKYSEAANLLQKGVEKFPNDFVINLIYGLSLSQQNEHAKAKDALENALKLNPDDMTVLSSLGFTLNQLKEDDKALVHLNKALAIDPKNIQVLSILGIIHEGKKEYTISDSLYKRALEVDTNNALILNNYAYSLSERGLMLNEALDMSQRAVKQEPTNSSYLDTIGWIYFRLGRYEEAKENILKASATEDKNATILNHLGDVYFKLGEKVKANEFWNKALKFDVNNEEIRLKIEKGEL
jgi:tetratricopeptide (TPR) repeat protein